MDKDELKNGTLNGVVFTEIVRDRVCDWISMHKRQAMHYDCVFIDYITFSRSRFSVAKARYVETPFEDYEFFIFCYPKMMVKKGENQIVTYVYRNNDKLTSGWDGFSYLMFDSKGFSYEVNKDDYKYLSTYERYCDLKKDSIDSKGEYVLNAGKQAMISSL